VELTEENISISRP